MKNFLPLSFPPFALFILANGSVTDGTSPVISFTCPVLPCLSHVSCQGPPPERANAASKSFCGALVGVRVSYWPAWITVNGAQATAKKGSRCSSAFAQNRFSLFHIPNFSHLPPLSSCWRAHGSTTRLANALKRWHPRLPLWLPTHAMSLPVLTNPSLSYRN
ncbi:hypothetical protein V8C34DRAFT_153896 [Trichoderma compactum]